MLLTQNNSAAGLPKNDKEVNGVNGVKAHSKSDRAHFQNGNGHKPENFASPKTVDPSKIGGQ